MSFNVVYANKDKIKNKIAQGIILPESLIITNDQPDNAEVYYYDDKGELKQLIKKTKFDSETEARIWIAKYNYAGETISIKNASGQWVNYTVSDNGQLEPVSQDEFILNGYYLNGQFYTDASYTVLLEKNNNCLYIDKNTNCGYTWDGTQYKSLTPEATEKLIGAMKLYQTHGKNIDGTMSQKVITEGVQSINLNVDSEDEECLIIDLPWDDTHGKY